MRTTRWIKAMCSSSSCHNKHLEYAAPAGTRAAKIFVFPGDLKKKPWFKMLPVREKQLRHIKSFQSPKVPNLELSSAIDRSAGETSVRLNRADLHRAAKGFPPSVGRVMTGVETVMAQGMPGSIVESCWKSDRLSWPHMQVFGGNPFYTRVYAAVLGGQYFKVSEGYIHEFYETDTVGYAVCLGLYGAGGPRSADAQFKGASVTPH